MHQKGFITEEFYQFYKELRKALLPTIILQPHLVIYLDRPVKDCLAYIKKRNIPWENNGKVIDMTYLGTIESKYRDYLKEVDYESEILIYDWTVPGSVDSIVQDIEHLDLDTYEWHKHSKFENWSNVADEDTWCHLRHKYTHKLGIMKYFKMFPYDVPELFYPPDDFYQRDWVIKNVVCIGQIFLNRFARGMT
ncbi:unnamed protein product [Soboliphyme baturini]|uniref:DNK domain-containing protein n=1 Tax=Soboliphyme baturini TaxID=241478 RepID=A0A183J855_9BILA|nr:unnamed protein product [Soboliphyme baturini]